MLWKRKDKCSDCGGNYVIDTDKKQGRCRCGLIKNLHIPSKELLSLFFVQIDSKGKKPNKNLDGYHKQAIVSIP